MPTYENRPEDLVTCSWNQKITAIRNGWVNIRFTGS
jgi:hypothetical protein